MAVDKNLFLYDLAVVAIMKNEEPYVREWLDYHLLAGVDHFYIYDNEESDSQKKILQPYIERGVVTHIPYVGKARQYEAYNEAVQNFRYFCRYMAFIDADEFIFPQNNKTIVEVVDEVLRDKPNAAALAVNIHNFGSNYQEIADYSRGVLERFTRHASDEIIPPLPNTGLPGGNAHVSSIADPRKVNFFYNPHFAAYFEGFHAVNENGGVVPIFHNNPPTVSKIVMNHYSVKSREEYFKKIERGTADAYHNIYHEEKFNEMSSELNEVFDDSILRYRDARRSVVAPFGQSILENVAARKPINYPLLSNALVQNLFPSLIRTMPINFFAGKMETFLTCRALASHLREVMFDKTAGNFFEEAALNAVHKTMYTQLPLSGVRMLLAELPKILPLDYPVVNKIREGCLQLIPQIQNVFRVYDPNAWKEFVNLQYALNLLKTFDEYEHD